MKGIPQYLANYIGVIGIAHVVELREHNPKYKEIFLLEYERIMKELGGHYTSLSHVGSTSVEGLCAKPIIDMVLTYTETREFDRIKEGLLKLGYIFRKDLLPDRVYFVLEDKKGIRYFSISVFTKNDERASEIIAFRDNLLENPDIMKQYDAIKRKLFSETSDRGDYLKRKSEFMKRFSKRLIKTKKS